MGTLFRSQPMVLMNIFISFEAAHDVLDELGKVGAVQFRDLNPDVNAFSRSFVNEVKRIDEMERRLHYFMEQMRASGIRDDFQFYEPRIDADATLDDGEGTNLTVLAELESRFEELDRELQQLMLGHQGMQRNIAEALEERFVLEKAQNEWFAEGGLAEAAAQASSSDDEAEGLSLLSGGQQDRSNLGFVAGVLNTDKIRSFERVLWRALHGNLVMHHATLPEEVPDTKSKDFKLVEKSAFIIFFTSQRGEEKILRMCDAFEANRYNCPESHVARQQRISDLELRREDLNRVLAVNKRRSDDLLNNTIATNIDAWRTRIVKEKYIYHTMNLFDYDVQRTTLIAEGWCPEKRLPEVREALSRASQRSRALVEPVLHVVQTKDTPPTYFETNKFTKAFQNIVNAYGVPRYMEVNPAPFTIISFPFLFGVMFGDMGHGTLLLLFSLWLVINETKLGRTSLNEMVKTCYDGRYVLVLMSFFAVYMGVMYNECFAVPLTIFGSPKGFQYHDRNTPDSYWNRYLEPYPIGVNPDWLLATNNLLYSNSLKMKMSILIGVTQMVFGICLSAFNALFFRKDWHHKWDVWMEFIPQLIFMLSIFGYMCFLILYKWCVNWMNVELEAPKLLNLLIAMFQSPGSLAPEYKIFGTTGDGQHAAQVILLLLAVFAVPWMLVPKPLLLRREWRKRTPNWREIEARQKGGDVDGASAAGVQVDTAALPALGAPEDDLHFQGGKLVKKKRGKGKYAPLGNENDEFDDDDDEFYDDEVIEVDGSHGEEEEFDFGELFVHQLIHTIEFVLGAISNTASYLRLWALSLAHSELSNVFLEKVAILTMNIGVDNIAMGAISQFIGFGAWAGLTVGVLLMMESLSAFLHALRLHWVEFQNKFYRGDGHLFVPFDFRKLLKNEAVPE